ncbi:MAG: MarR family transcriptional regulator [Deltaproteobacteria bacterium]|nr:MarR family transcriptional regulator [Deltaproteobacteria bacterium]
MKFHYLLMADFTMQQKLLMRRLKDTGLTSGQPKVLAFLSECNGASQAEIAKACFLEAATVTSVIDGMVRQGLVDRRRDDRRTYQIWLTDKGAALAAQVNAEFLSLEKVAFSRIREADAAALQRLLAEVYSALEQQYSTQRLVDSEASGEVR